MKICDLALYSPETSSGVKTYIENKIRYISSQPQPMDHVVVVPASTDQLVVQGRSKVYYVRGIPCFYPKLRLVANIGKVARIIQAEAPDLIELNCQYTLPWAGFLATRKSRIPVIGVYHFDLPACVHHNTRKAGWLTASLLERITKFYVGVLYRHFTRTLVLSDSMVPKLSRLGVHRVEQVSCGVDTTTFNPDRHDPNFREQLGISPATTILLYVGRLSPEKEIDVLLKAYESLSKEDYVLLIAGDGPEKEKIQRYSSSHLGVRYLGHFDSHTQLSLVYASSDLFIMPGRHETFGMATLEALACGLPVVGIAEGGSETLVTPQVGALARPGDAQDLAAKISIVASWNRDAIRKHCHSFVSARFSWEKVFVRYFEIYQLLIAEAQSARIV